MKNFTKKISIASALAAATLPLISLAQTALPDNQNFGYAQVIAILGKAADVLFGLMVAVSVFYIIRAGWYYIQGEKVDDAKQSLLNAGIGLAIGLLAKIIPKIVLALVGTGAGVTY